MDNGSWLAALLFPIPLFLLFAGLVVGVMLLAGLLLVVNLLVGIIIAKTGEHIRSRKNSAAEASAGGEGPVALQPARGE